MLGKKSSERSEKNVFLYSHEYRIQKMGGKNARNNFSRNTRVVRAKNVRKKSSGKSEKNVSLYSNEYRDQKMGGKKHEYCEQKMLGKKSSEKSEKNVLLYSHKYRYEKMGGKKLAKQFFQKHKNNAIKNC